MMFSIFKIMLTISYASASVTLRDLCECRQKCSEHNFWAG